MARQFVAVANDPQRLFSQIRDWATQTGVSLNGDASAGIFRGNPGFPASLLFPVISGSYSVSGNQVTIRTDQDLPTREVDKRLQRVGLALVSSQ
jgi:hypothetical protein